MVLFPLARASMKNTGRLTLAELKAKADQSNVVENLEAIQGAGLFNCHGKWGAIGKGIKDAGEWVLKHINFKVEVKL